MTDSHPVQHRATQLVIVIVAVLAVLASIFPLEPSSADALPNPCTIMIASRRAVNALSPRTVLGAPTAISTHSSAVRACRERVGPLLVQVTVGTGLGGYGGFSHARFTHPTGLGAHATLIVARLLGPRAGPYDLISFQKGSLWVSVWADGAPASALTALARVIYRWLPASATHSPTTTSTSSSPSSALIWNPIGPSHFADFLQTTSGGTAPSSGLSAAGKIGAVAVDLANPLIMYVGAAGGDNRGPLSEAGVYATTDGGATWHPVDTGLTNTQVNDLWMSQASPGTLLAATEGGIFRTTDAAAHWTRVDTRESIGFATIGSTIFAGTSDGVASSTNGGTTWTSVEFMPYPVTALGSAGSTLYVADEDALWSWTPASTWTKIYQSVASSTGAPTDWISWVVADPSNSSTVYMLHCPQPTGQPFCLRAVSKSTDGGVSWSTATVPTTYVSSQFNAQSIALDSLNPQTVYVGGNSVLSTSLDGGTTFTQTNVNTDIWALYAWPGRAGTFFAGTDQGLYLLTNGGATWKSLNGNLTTSLLYNVSTQGSAIFAAAQDYSSFASFDGGATWLMQPTPTAAKGEGGEVVIDPVDPSTVFAMGICCGLQVSFDGGHNFAPVSAVPASSYNQSPQGIAVSSTGVVYVATAVGVYASTDGGHTFQATDWPMTHPSMIALGPPGTGVVFVGTRDTPGNAGASSTGLLDVSTDGGTTWQQASLAGATGYPTSVAVDPSNPSTVLLGMSQGPQLGGGILVSTDGGRNFSPANAGVPSIAPYDASVAYPAIWQISYEPNTSLALAATSNGLLATTSPSTSWRSVSTNAVPRMFTGVAWSSATVLVSTMGEGILQAPVTELLASLRTGAG